MGKNELVLSYLKALINQVNGKTEEERLLRLLNKGLNYTRLRNAIIINDFDKRKGNKPIMKIYNDLANQYCISNNTVREIIKLRHFNEVLTLQPSNKF